MGVGRKDAVVAGEERCCGGQGIGEGRCKVD